MADLREQLQSSLGSAYTIDRELGGGGMARVFVAAEEALGRSVAIKVLPPELGTELSLERFVREVRIAAQLQHPHIVPVLAAGDAGGLRYYTTPFVPGETLRQRLVRERQLATDEAIRLTTELASALGHAHSHGIVHRDVKPENVLLSDNRALLTDFGIARAVVQAKGETLTATGLSVGTPQYMSPEQAVGAHDVDARADIYSLGCVLYELLVGQPPFTAPSAQGVVAQHFAAPFPQVRHSRPDVPAAVDEVIAKATAKSPADRYATAAEFANALAAAGRRDAPSIAGQPRGRRFGVALVAVGAVGVIAGAALIARSRSSSNSSGTTHATTAAASRSVAVLPFSAVGADTANAYFADGMTEALISALSSVRGLRVAPRSSAFALKGTKLAARQIGETLHVGTLLDGSVQRAGDRVRIAVSLSDPAHDSALWSGTFDGDRSDVFGMQDSIAKAVVGALRVQLAAEVPAQLVRRATASGEAYDLYLRGRALAGTFTEPNLLKSITLFEQALRKDSTFALAYAGLTYSYGQLADTYWAPAKAYPKAKDAALRALALDPTLAETHVALGMTKVFWDWDLEGSERELRRALDLAPNNPLAHASLAFRLTLTQRNEAIHEIETALALDPLSAEIAAAAEFTYLWLGDADRLSALAARLLQADSTDDFSRALLGYALAAKGDRSRALEVLKRPACSLPYVCAFQAMAYGLLGERKNAERCIQFLLEMGRHQYVAPDAIGFAYAALGDRDRAIDAITQGVEVHSATVLTIGVFPPLTPLRTDPRFQALLLKKIGLP